MLDFVFAGLWATVSLSVAYFVKNKATAIFGPYLFLLFFHFVTSVLFVWDLRVDVTPINFIRATEIILAELALLVVLDIFVLYRGEVKDVL